MQKVIGFIFGPASTPELATIELYIVAREEAYRQEADVGKKNVIDNLFLPETTFVRTPLFTGCAAQEKCRRLAKASSHR
jgi:hypothetical protein